MYRGNRFRDTKRALRESHCVRTIKAITKGIKTVCGVRERFVSFYRRV